MPKKIAATKSAKKYVEMGALKSPPAPTKVQYNQTSMLMSVPPGETVDPDNIELPENCVVRRSFKAHEGAKSTTQVQIIGKNGRSLFSGSEAEYAELLSITADSE